MMVPATPSATHKMQCKHMDRFLTKDRTRFSKLFGNVLLCLLSICFSHRPNHCATTCQEHLAGITVWLCVRCLHVETYECVDDSCRRILSPRPCKML